MKTKLLVLLFLAGCILPNLLFAQFTQQGTKLVGTGYVGNPHEGTSVAISADGNTAVIGAPDDSSITGAVWVFIHNGVYGRSRVLSLLVRERLVIIFTRVFQLPFLQMVILLSREVTGITTRPGRSGYSPEAAVFGHSRVLSLLAQELLEVMLLRVFQLPFLQMVIQL